MARLIDAEPIVKFIKDGLNNPNKEEAFGHTAVQILTEIEYAPTVNAVEVVRWIPVTQRLPESQTPVLVVAVSKGMRFPYIFKAAHINHHEITEDEYGWTDGEYDSEYDEENDCFWLPECWYECNAVEGNANWVMDDDYSITHWMPLPQPPKGE